MNMLQPKSASHLVGVTLLISFVLLLASEPASSAPPAGACDLTDSVGGGQAGVSPGPNGPPNSLGWDVGSGQCNGSFTVTRKAVFPNSTSGIELGIRAEQRGQGQVARKGAFDYEVQLGPDPTNINRAWWNFQVSVANGGNLNTLDALTLAIHTEVGPNVPAQTEVDLLAFRSVIDDRHPTTNRGLAAKNPTSTYNDLYQISQNPVFGWFANPNDTDGTSDGFDNSVEGAWRFTLTAEEGGQFASVSVCIHTPNAACSTEEHLHCYDVLGAPNLNIPGISLDDQYGRDTNVTAKKAKQICIATNKNNEGVLNQEVLYVCYDTVPKRSVNQEITVSNQFGSSQTFTIKKGSRVCVPSNEAP